MAAKRIIDLSYVAATKLDMVRDGTAFVQVEALDRAPDWPAPVSQETVVASTPGVVPASADAGSPLSPVAAAAAEIVPASGDPQLFLQIGAFGERPNAEQLRSRLGSAFLELDLRLVSATRFPCFRKVGGPDGDPGPSRRPRRPR